MLRRTRSFSSRSRRPRPKVTWAEFSTVANTTPVTNTQLDIDLLSGFKASGGNTQNVTVRRIILDLNFWWNAAPSPSDFLKWGLMVTQPDATSGLIPSVANRPYMDWMWLSQIQPFSHTRTAYATTNPNTVPTTGACESVHIDTRTRRKIDDIGLTLYFTSIWTISVAGSWHYNLYGRVLLQEH